MKAGFAAGASALAWLTAGVTPPPPPAPVPEVVEVDAATGAPKPRSARLPGFAPALADEPRIVGPSGWRSVPLAAALPALAAASAGQRQSARWTYALSLIAAGRAPEALGVLEVMRQDDPDLALVENFQLAIGRVLAELDRPDEALAELDRPGLAANAEACAWRVRALGAAGGAALALRQLGCAVPAINARAARDRAPFVLAAADAALDQGAFDAARAILAALPDGDPAANLRRARIALAQGRVQEADLRFGRAARNGSHADRIDADIGRIEVAVARRALAVPEALKRLERIRYIWRGGPIERRALWLSWRLAREGANDRAALAAGATLVRHHRLGPQLVPLMAEVQTILAALLDPANRLPIDQAAGLYWDYRDLGPSGAEGDLLVTRLADRLQAVGLYPRAAELLEHQLISRAQDLAQGPLSVRVARLHILAGQPDRALGALRATGRTLFPAAMLWDRQRMEAIALHQLGRGAEALAVLQDVPDAAGLREELLWKQRNWQALAEMTGPRLPPADGLSDVRQAILLRHAIALAMLGREAELRALRDRYAAAFAPLPTANAFELLTRPARPIDATGFAEAMAAIPTVSPAGALADLIDAAPAPKRG